MTRYLQSKPGSIEEVAAKMSKYAAESEYQQMFKKELEKTGKGIGAMTPAEKKAFFNKIDSKYTAKNEKVDNPYAVGMAAAMKAKNDKPPLKKSTITKAHDIAKSIKKEDVELNEDMYTDTLIKNFHGAYTRNVRRPKAYSQSLGLILDKIKKMVRPGSNQYKKAIETLKSIKGFDKITDYQSQILKDFKPIRQKAINIMMNIKKELSDLSKVDYNNQQNVNKHIDTLINLNKKLEPEVKEDYTKKEEAKYPHKMFSKDGKEVEAKTPADHEKYAKMGYTHKNETHSFMTKDMNKSKKDAKGEKEIVDPAPKMKFKEAYKKVKKEAMNTVGDATADQANQRVGDGPKENDPDIKKPKAKADTGSKATPIDTSPEVEYKN